MSVTARRDRAASRQLWRRAAALAAEPRRHPPGARRAGRASIGCGTSLYMAQAYAALREGAGHGAHRRVRRLRAAAARAYDVVVALSRSGTTTEVRARADALDPLAHGGDHRGRRTRRSRTPPTRSSRSTSPTSSRSSRRASPPRALSAAARRTRASTSAARSPTPSDRARRAAAGRAGRGRPLGVPRPRLDRRARQRGGAEAARVGRRRGPRPTPPSSTATGRSASPGRAPRSGPSGRPTTSCSTTPARPAR